MTVSLGPLARRLSGGNVSVSTLMEKLTTLRLKNSVDHTVPAMALKSVVSALPAPIAGEALNKDIAEAYAIISRTVIPRFIGKPSAVSYRTPGASSLTARSAQAAPSGDSILDITNEPVVETIDVLIEVVRCFGSALQPYEVEALFDAVVSVLHNTRANSATKKRAVVAVSILAVYLPQEALVGFIDRTAKALARPQPETQRLYISIMSSMARSIPQKFGDHIDSVYQPIVEELSQGKLETQLEAISEGDDQGDFNDVREAALVALESFQASCPLKMRSHAKEIIEACLRYIKYDPNYVDDDDDMDDVDDEDEDFGDDDDDDYGADAGLDDDDDPSWKVRRCAAKVLHAIINTRNGGDLLENGILYADVAPPLIKRFDEREEAVRLEIISALSQLVRKTGDGVVPDYLASSSPNADDEPGIIAPPSRKRRRQSSVSSAANPIPLSPTAERKTSIPAKGPRADLAEHTAAIVAASIKQLKGKQIPTKQAIVNLLNDIVGVQHGGLSEYLVQLVDPVLDTVKPASGSAVSSSLSAGGGNASATPTTLRIAGLRLVGHIANTHTSQSLQPYLTRIIDSVLQVVSDRFYKLSSEAVSTSEEVIKSITPPRSLSAAKFKADIQRLYSVITDRATASNVDTEVRQKAIQALGTLLSRTGTEGAALLPLAQRSAALESLLGLLGNETSRLSAVRAIDVVSASATASVPFDGEWVRQVAAHLAAQLGKANNTLRGSSINALRHLVQSPAAQGELDLDTITMLVSALHPVIMRNDQRLLTSALRILKVLAQAQPQLFASQELISSICSLLHTSVASTVMEPLLQLVTVIGQNGVGQHLMQGLLKNVGVVGDPAVVGKVVGNLLVASGDSAGVTIDSFVNEIYTSQKDPVRVSLALSVLGEAGLRLGAASPIEPTLFAQQFNSEYDKVSISAAVALGRAGAGNVPLYLPVILVGLAAGSGSQYLLLQSIKEVLQQVAIDRVDISEYMSEIWEKLLEAAVVENNKAVCAECIGRLAITSPKTYIPRLQGLLDDKNATLRAISVQALRYALPDTGEEFDAVLREHIIPMLCKALVDNDLEIRRLAMTAIISAANNKPELIHANINQLAPYIYSATQPRRELVREVMMGPFKHLVDDGLEVRKGAYECLYALMETAFSRLDVISLYGRIIDGLGDDHDVRATCNLMVSRLAYLSPEETTARLDDIAGKYRATLSNKLRENAVKQELEKQEDANKSVLRTTLLLGDRLRSALADGSVASSASLSSPAGRSGNGGVGGDVGSSAHPVWTQYWDWVNKTFERQLRALRVENQDLGGSL